MLPPLLAVVKRCEQGLWRARQEGVGGVQLYIGPSALTLGLATERQVCPPGSEMSSCDTCPSAGTFPAPPSPAPNTAVVDTASHLYRPDPGPIAGTGPTSSRCRGLLLPTPRTGSSASLADLGTFQTCKDKRRRRALEKGTLEEKGPRACWLARQTPPGSCLSLLP